MPVGAQIQLQPYHSPSFETDDSDLVQRRWEPCRTRQVMLLGLPQGMWVTLASGSLQELGRWGSNDWKDGH